MIAKIIEKNYNEHIQVKVANRKSYKMKDENFRLWLAYLATRPEHPNYIDYKKFKKGQEAIGEV